VILSDGRTFNATWQQDHWVAGVKMLSVVGSVRIIARVLADDGDVLAEGSVEVVVRNPWGPPPRVVILTPKEWSRVDPIAVVSGRVEGDYPPIRLEASWDLTTDWTSFEPHRNWTIAIPTTGLSDGSHILRVRAFDGMFSNETAYILTVGPEGETPEVGWETGLAIVLLLAVVVTLVLTRPKPPPKT